MYLIDKRFKILKKLSIFYKADERSSESENFQTMQILDFYTQRTVANCMDDWILLMVFFLTVTDYLSKIVFES